MDAERLARAKAIFLEAREATGEARAQIVSSRCGTDEALRAYVDRLLVEDASAKTVSQGSTASTEPLQPLPAKIGPYRILERIGEGGMGTVYLGEQTEPIRRKVAVKVLKAGMDSHAVLARFEAERQALALMDHANIAKVLDAGEAENGRPYFAMEWIKGEPISQYCDTKGLSNRQRLELFIPVCNAVQHAHQKGVIHRDLKPSNILVMEQDEVAVPKVIDFGIAKAVVTPLTDKTLHTSLGQFLGTPEYMSPEQAQVGALDIDTRADVYSLGVVLYELLTGTVPFSTETLRRAGHAEVLRIIREEEPPKPSTRISTLGDAAGVAASRRRTQVGKLAKELRGDLDWVILKALEKDRSRRYDTANALAAEVRRFLHEEPVLAGPPSAIYRTRKFMKRHRAGVSIAAASILAIVTAAGGLAVALRESNRQRAAAEAARAEAEAVKNFLTGMLRSADPDRAGKDVTVQEILERAAATVGERFGRQPLVEAEVRYAIAETYTALERYDLALPQVKRSYAIQDSMLGAANRRTIRTLEELAWTQWAAQSGEAHESLPNYRKAFDLASRELGATDTLTFEIARNLGSMTTYPETLEEAAKWLGIARHAVENGGWPVRVREDREAWLLNAEYFYFGKRGDRLKQLETVQKELAINERLHRPDNSSVMASRNNLAMMYSLLGRHDEALPILAELVEYWRESHGDNSFELAKCLNNYGAVLIKSGRFLEAEEQLRESHAIKQRIFGENDGRIASSRLQIARCMILRGAYEEALADVEETLSWLKTARPYVEPGKDSTRTWSHGTAAMLQGEALLGMDRLRESEGALLRGEAILREAGGVKDPYRREAVTSLVTLYKRLGRPDEADSWSKELAASSESTAIQEAAAAIAP